MNDNNLMVFEKNGQLWTDSREVAFAIEKNHKELLRDIRVYSAYLTESKFALSDYFIESSYQDSTGRTLPCYQCTKMGCDMIANKLQGKKGVIFTAKYVKAFGKMQEFIEKGAQMNNQIPFKDQIEAIGAAAEILRMNEASKVLMIGTHFKSYNIPTDFLPVYVSNGNRQYKSATELLKENGIGISATKFNQRLQALGYLEERERSSSNGGTKKFKALTEKGLKYGENLINPKNQKEVQPCYYVDTFMELCRLLELAA